jgi:hypothetical protein
VDVIELSEAALISLIWITWMLLDVLILPDDPVKEMFPGAF